MNRIVYLDAGRLMVVTPVMNTEEEITEDGAIERAMLQVPTLATDIRVLSESALPPSREHRNAWAYNGDKTAVVVDEALSQQAAVPQSVAMWQARTVLIDAGLLDDVDAFLAAIVDPIERKKAQAKWEFSNTVRRDDPLMSGMSASLGLTDAQLDNLFVLAAAL